MRELHVPLWPELSIDKSWSEAIRYPGFISYIPSECRGGKGVDRVFFFGVLASLAPEYLVTLIEDCWRQRVAKAQDKQQVIRPVAATDKWLKLLMEQPFISSKYILASHLFKQSSASVLLTTTLFLFFHIFGSHLAIIKFTNSSKSNSWSPSMSCSSIIILQDIITFLQLTLFSL